MLPVGIATVPDCAVKSMPGVAVSSGPRVSPACLVDHPTDTASSSVVDILMVKVATPPSSTEGDPSMDTVNESWSRIVVVASDCVWEIERLLAPEVTANRPTSRVSSPSWTESVRIGYVMVP